MRKVGWLRAEPALASHAYPPFSAASGGRRRWFPSCSCPSRKAVWCQQVDHHAVAVSKNLDGARRATRTLRASIVSPPPKGTSSPEPVPFDRIASFPRTGFPRALPRRFRYLIQTGTNPSALSLSPDPKGSVPGTTRSTRTSRHCLAAHLARLPPASTQATLRICRVDRRGVSAPAPDTTPASADFPALSVVDGRSVTSGEGVAPHAFVAVRPGFRLGVVSALARDFRGQEPEAPPYPCSGNAFPVRHRLRVGLSGKPLRACRGSAFCRPGFARDAEVDEPRSRTSPCTNSPRRRRLNGPRGPGPPGADSHRFRTTTARTRVRACPRRPAPTAGRPIG